MSSVLSDLGNLHAVVGTVTADGTDYTMTSNDGSASLADNGTGDVTVTFGQPFLSAPGVTATAINTFAATVGAAVVSVVASATNSVQFNVAKSGATDVAPAALDASFGFIAIGLRNN